MVEKPEFKDMGLLEVTFVHDGKCADIIKLTPASQTVEVEVKLNIEGVKWNVEADDKQGWCTVDEYATYEGSDSFTITVDENKTFDDREIASLYLCTGDRKVELQVKQSGNLFIIDQVLGLGMKKAGSEDVEVKVEKGSKWTISSPDWIDVDTVRVSTVEDAIKYKMTVQWEAIPEKSASRLGVVGLHMAEQEAPAAKYALWQFGDDDGYEFDSDGNICMLSSLDNAKALEIQTPSNLIDGLRHPDWVESEEIDNGEVTSWYLRFHPNPSDCYKIREAQISYVTMGLSEEKPLPVIYQKSHPAHALMSAEGLLLFAERFNAGQDVSDWMDGNKVSVLYPIDLSEIDADWAPIGTTGHPFKNLEFNGGKKAISGLTGPLFGICESAKISNVVIDATCNVSYNDDIDSDLYLASLAERISKTTIENSHSAANIQLAASTTQADVNVYIGGLVAYVDSESSISRSVHEGTLEIEDTRSVPDGKVYIGGLAAYVEGVVDGCNNSGKIIDKSGALSHYVGGLIGKLDNNLKLSLDKPVNCDLDIASLQEGGELVVGGIIGVSKKDITLTYPQWHGTIAYKMPATTIKGKYVYLGGVLGYAEASETIIDQASSKGQISVTASKGVSSEVPMAIGGILGCAGNGCKVLKSDNTCELKWNTYTSRSYSGGVVSAGGIVGRVDKGLTEISGCANKAIVQNYHQQAAKWATGKLLATRTGGIIGAYGYVRNEDTYDMDLAAFDQSKLNKIIISGCTSEANVLASRGLVGGIAGYLYNATVRDCTYTGSSLKTDYFWNCNLGGVAGAVEKSVIQNCTVREGNLSGGAQGNCEFKIGGIVAYLYTASEVTDCQYYGKIDKVDGAEAVEYYGGIVGEAQEKCSVTGCRYGGSLLGETINKDNFGDYIVGNYTEDLDIEIKDCNYWTGR